MVFYRLNVFAFMAHMILERGDRLSQRCVATTSRQELWHTLRTTMRMILVGSWMQMLRLSLDEEPAGPSEISVEAGTTTERPAFNTGMIEMVP